MYADFGSHIVVVEIDEHDMNTAAKQTNGLFLDFDHRPLVFLRFNPDATLICLVLNILVALSKINLEWY
jgi:hypothetical protein